MINVLFPMAGESSRFNYKFKPFLYLDNRRFIEHTLEPFIRYDNLIITYNFIVTEEQEKKNNVTNTIKTIFNEISNKINVIIIPIKTQGPYQTILSAKKSSTSKPFVTTPSGERTEISNDNWCNNIIVCDIDHSIDITSILEKITTDNDIIIPLWNIHDNEYQNWGKVILQNKIIHKFCEKEFIKKEENQEVYGIIGCYYFRTLELFPNNDNFINLSDFFGSYFKKLNIDFVNVKNAYFYGTPEMVENTIKLRRKFGTVICDVDGVLLKHNNNSNDNPEHNIIIGQCINKLNKIREENNKIILVTARPVKTRQSFEKLLHIFNIPYDDIVMGLNPGPRYLINDIKPSNPFVKQSIGFNLIRDSGIDNLQLNESNNYNIEIIKNFKGNSFSNTYLLKSNEQYFVRKHIIKNIKSKEHCERLKRQCDDLKRFYYYNKELVPKVVNECDNNYDYYIDIEYLEHYKQLDYYSKNIQYDVLDKLIKTMETDVYCYRKKNTDVKFIEEFFETKIYPKLTEFENECEIMNYLINSNEVNINDKTYFGLRNIFEKLNIHNFNTEWINPIHGDFTLENILYDLESDKIKIIDMEGSRYVDSCYFDLGKIFQSIVSKYKEWNTITNIIINKDINNLSCIDKYFHYDYEEYKPICNLFAKIMDVEDTKIIFNKGIFYMSTYFIRFVQFRRKISDDHGIFAIIMAVVWLNNILK
jgi:ribosomal protein L23